MNNDDDTQVAQSVHDNDMAMIASEQSDGENGVVVGGRVQASIVGVGPSLPPRVAGKQSGVVWLTIALILPSSLSSSEEQEEDEEHRLQYECVITVLWWGQSEEESITFTYVYKFLLLLLLLL